MAKLMLFTVLVNSFILWGLVNAPPVSPCAYLSEPPLTLVVRCDEKLDSVTLFGVTLVLFKVAVSYQLDH